MNIIGLSAYNYDSAACLVQDGKIVAAAQEERFTREKNNTSFPEFALHYCLEEAKITVADLDFIAYYDKPLKRFERRLKTFLANAPSGLGDFLHTMPQLIKHNLWLKEHIEKQTGYSKTIIFPEHHESHAASAFFPSPFQEAAFLTLDGVGDWTTTSYGVGSNNAVTIESELSFPHSLGLLYSAFTHYIGFMINSEEYKVMELASHGQPKYRDLIFTELVELKEDGSFKLNGNFFNYCKEPIKTNSFFNELFGRPPRHPGSPLHQLDIDLACSIQDVVEEIVLHMVNHVHTVTKQKNLCLSGDISFNSSINGRILRESSFDELWVQPAIGNAGGALGAALFTWHNFLKNPKSLTNGRDSQNGSRLGPSFSNSFIRSYLEQSNVSYEELSDEEIPEKIAGEINNQKIIGWFQGRMEYGPMALGGRSIIGDPRSAKIHDTINQKIKRREDFVTIGSSALKEHASDYFEIDCESPYMLLAAPIKKEFPQKLTSATNNSDYSQNSAVTRPDNTARIQTVSGIENPIFYKTIHAFFEKSDCGFILNTSFNVDGEPIVCTPEDAYCCFKDSELDCLMMGNFFIEKNKQYEGKEER